jgi:hypothetical protein
MYPPYDVSKPGPNNPRILGPVPVGDRKAPRGDCPSAEDRFFGVLPIDLALVARMASVGSPDRIRELSEGTFRDMADLLWGSRA